MFTRRKFLGTVGVGLVALPSTLSAKSRQESRKRLAVVTTEWRYHSHAWHMAERFLVGRAPFSMGAAGPVRAARFSWQAAAHATARVYGLAARAGA